MFEFTSPLLLYNTVHERDIAVSRGKAKHTGSQETRLRECCFSAGLKSWEL